jgi:thiol peroxidase
MAAITFQGTPVLTCGDLPALGSAAPDFRLTGGDLADRRLGDWAGKVKILNIVPSLDTPICALSAKKFSREAAGEPGMAVLTISADLPFAQGRFCKTEGGDTAVTLSEMRDRSFGKDYGAEMIDGPLAGLLSRAVVVINREDRVVYTQQVPEIKQEPDYDAALQAAREAL